VGCSQKVRQAFICRNLHVGSIWAFNKKKLLEASGMVFRFHSLQVTFLVLANQIVLKKFAASEEKKTRCEAKLTTPIL